MTTATLECARRYDQLIHDLVDNIGFDSEKEMRAKLRDALVWADKHGIQIHGVTVRKSVGAMIEVGESGTGVGDIQFTYWTDKKTWAQPAPRKLVQGAVAYLFMNHPIAKRFARAA